MRMKMACQSTSIGLLASATRRTGNVRIRSKIRAPSMKSSGCGDTVIVAVGAAQVMRMALASLVALTLSSTLLGCTTRTW